MARGVTNDINYKNIADAIREKTGAEDTYTPSEMPGGINDVYDKARTDEWSEFWDSFQDYGKLTDYRYAFGADTWCDAIFKPKYDMYVDWADGMFYNSRITDLAGILDKQNIKLNFSESISFTHTFAFSELMTHIGTLDTTNADYLKETFWGCIQLKTIDKLKLRDDYYGTQFSDRCFKDCLSLKNITIEGTIRRSNLDMRYSPLSKASIISVINALSENVSGMTLTLKKSAVNEAFSIDVDDETTWAQNSEYYILRHSKDNWTISYV